MQNSSLHEFTLQVNVTISLNLKLKERVLKQHLLFKLFLVSDIYLLSTW